MYMHQNRTVQLTWRPRAVCSQTHGRTDAGAVEAAPSQGHCAGAPTWRSAPLSTGDCPPVTDPNTPAPEPPRLRALFLGTPLPYRQETVRP